MDPPPPYTPLLGDAEASPDPQHLQHPPQPPPASLRPIPPQLPPRPPSNQLSAWAQDSKTGHGHGRSASQVSLVPVGDESKRKLLVIYIHGFMGNETSFQSFPAHLHNLLCVTLDPLGYLVHTKVYPKFKTRYNILVATENFSQWLSKFENENTDVILLGHSMGGLLAADVALLRDYTGKKRHRILGIIAFDTPFLGMHPGVISAGLGSIFRPAPKSPGEDAHGVYADGAEGSSQSNMSLRTVSSGGSQVDEFYSKPPARNYTVVVPKIEGTWDSTLHFINKYHSRLTQATGQYLMSHLEFGGCLADIIGLKNRYSAIRALEDGVIGVSGNTDRVRFVNYYTSSTGRIKGTAERIISPDSGKVRAFDGEHGVPGVELDHDLIGHERSSQYVEIGVVEVGEPSSSSMKHQRNASVSSYNTASSMDDMKHIPADPITDDEFGGEPVALHIVDADEFSVVDGRSPTELSVHENIQYSKYDKEYSGNGKYNEKSEYHDNGESSSMYQLNDISRQITTDTMETLEKQISIDLALSDFQLPPIPPPPEEPPSFDYSQIPDAMVRKVAEKEAARVRKSWEKAVKDYEKAVNSREKELEKLRKNKGKGVDRYTKEEDRRKERQLKDKAKEIERQERERRRELKEWDKEKDREEKEIEKKLKEEDKEREVTDRDRLKLMRGWEREKEREEREIQRELEKKEREIVRELERMEKEVQLRREKKQGEIENEREKQEITMEREKDEKEELKLTSQGIEENTHEKQELERLRKEQERMDAEHRRMNGIPEPPVQPLSPRSAPPSTATISASSSHSSLPISSPALRPETPKSNSASPKPKGKDKKKRDRRFCCLPSDKHDKCWVKVEMIGVDEVGAHCGLFFVGEAYERLVGDVAARMEEWVGEERTRRILESL